MAQLGNRQRLVRWPGSIGRDCRRHESKGSGPQEAVSKIDARKCLCGLASRLSVTRVSSRSNRSTTEPLVLPASAKAPSPTLTWLRMPLGRGVVAVSLTRPLLVRSRPARYCTEIASERFDRKQTDPPLQMPGSGKLSRQYSSPVTETPLYPREWPLQTE